MSIGSTYYHDRKACHFRVWAPLRDAVAVQIQQHSGDRILAMHPEEYGYWSLEVDEIEAGTRYFYQLDGNLRRPDPASHHQPEGVHRASSVIDHAAFVWQDGAWSNLPLDEWIIYELHVGTFTPAGTFAAIIPRLPELRALGINAIELMPVAQFPGDRNWGYDGVYPFAVQHSYGGPDGLKQLVNACHQQGIAVTLDVVYNHLGPEGNYTSNFAPYFAHRYQNPWGNALNFDDAYCFGVRHFFIENALYWLRHYHLDALRLDAINTMYDFGAKHILAELADAVKTLSVQLGKPHYLIAESDFNDVRVLQPQSHSGFGMDAQWSDDFHHALHALLTREQTGYYRDFGQCQQFAKAIRESFVYSGDYSPVRKRHHGNYGGDRPPSQFVVYAQNHDQVGNRMMGDRLSQLVSFDALKLAAGAVLLSPNLPMLFMGEEYGDRTPFLYFVSHTDPELIESVRQGRKREFAEFYAIGEPPDPEHPSTFQRSVLNWHLRDQGEHRILLQFYQRLIQFRQSLPALRCLSRSGLEVLCWESEQMVRVNRAAEGDHIVYLMNFNSDPVVLELEFSNQPWHKRLDSAEPAWQPPGEPESVGRTLLPHRVQGSLQVSMPPLSIALYQQLSP